MTVEKRSARLRFKRERKHLPARMAAEGASEQVRRSAAEGEDDNAGVQGAGAGVRAGTCAARYSPRLNREKQGESTTQPGEGTSHPLSRWRQRTAIKREYAAEKAGKTGAAAGSGAKKAQKKKKTVVERVSDFYVSHQQSILLFLGAGLLILVLTASFSSCGAMLQGGTQVLFQTSFTAETGDILGANEDYSALERDLQNTIETIEQLYPGYDEYRCQVSEIGHNPYELTAYLTVRFEDYTREEVQDALRALFDRQYVLRLEEEVELRTRTEGDGGQYEYRILNVILLNRGLGRAIAESGLTEAELERYRILLETKGNRPDLFEDDIYANGGGEYTDYDIPGEALTDERFSNMIREAEKYLGYPYVWGGSSPETSFDCSGFVSWVINHCGNGWNVGRMRAQGLKEYCAIIPKEEAKPGDLIFFQGTYDTRGASHVGIYVGNGMMIHCGDPISYASTESNYWKQHFYCFGRIPH